MFDADYKKTLANEIKIENLSLLDSVAGENELKFLLSKLDEQSFSPGNRTDKNKIDTFDLSNIKKHKFCANLHVHTNASDGTAPVEELLEAALKIANDNAVFDGSGFLLSVTDHDTVENAQKALQIVVSDKEKYKNLKLVLGVEISTTATEFLNQQKTLDIHTLLYCINPFEKRLTDFLQKKMKLKYELALKTLDNLKNALSCLLDELNLSLTLGEAAKIHPMITKGQDEVSHPLKKYIFARTLFSFYVDNNNEILEILKNENIDNELLSYEKPVFKYKNMFNNERYFYIYKDALEKYLNFLTGNKYSFALPAIPDYIEQYLLKAKEICELSHPDKYRSLEAFSDFFQTLEFINTLEYGITSIAHPARINTNYVNSDNLTFYEEFWHRYKTAGKDRAFAYEKYYQSYSSSKHYERLKAIDLSSQKFNFVYTGGIDSHGAGVCSRA